MNRLDLLIRRKKRRKALKKYKQQLIKNTIAELKRRVEVLS